jgi:porphobilinogen synthase
MTDARFPALRMRRLRRHDWTRRLVAETTLSPSDLIWPLFPIDGEKRREPVASMPGVERLSVDEIERAADEAAKLGIPAIALFPYTDPALKTEDGREALNPKNVICRAVRAIKRATPHIGVLCDVALDPYTSHGHDGVLVDGYVANDETNAILVKQALVQVEAGCDIIAPSDMMDGRVGALRDALDARGFEGTGILSYSVKYASAYYGPFREAADSAPGHGDRKSYQMDPANVREAVREARLDEAEGADVLMVKPALAYLDVIRAVRDATQLPLAAYNVSGEYSQVKAAAERGWIDEGRVVHENLTAIARAGADLLITYHAREALERGWLE